MVDKITPSTEAINPNNPNSDAVKTTSSIVIDNTVVAGNGISITQEEFDKMVKDNVDKSRVFITQGSPSKVSDIEGLEEVDLSIEPQDVIEEGIDLSGESPKEPVSQTQIVIEGGDRIVVTRAIEDVNPSSKVVNG